MNSRLLLVALASIGAGPAVESFDRDPGWEGVNNRVGLICPPLVKQDFGWSGTRHAAKGGGEIGGRVTRSGTPCFYAAELAKGRTLDEPLSASGTFAITSSSAGAGLFFGFFNSAQPGGSGRPIGSLGLDIDGEHAGGRLAVRMITAANQSAGTFVTPFERGHKPTPLRADGTRYTWLLKYDPAGGEGRGRFEFTINGDGKAHDAWEGKKFAVNLPEGYKVDGATFTHFGLMNLMKAGGTFSFYAGDLVCDGERLDLTKEPTWTAVNNRASYTESMVVGGHDFGYSPETHYAGGKAGEIGGVLWRTEKNAGRYAAAIGPVTVDDRLRAEGKVNFVVGGPDSDMYLGWFTPGEGAVSAEETGPFMGVHVGGPTRVGHYFQPAFTTGAGTRRRAEAGPVMRPGKASTFSIEYDPTGAGAIAATLDGVTEKLALPAGAKEAFAKPFTRFGLLTAGPGGQMVRIYLDDLTFTSSR